MLTNRLLASAFAAGAVFAGSALAQVPVTVITMPADEVRVVSFPVPVKTVYVGNPTIADVTVIDARHVFLQAKSFGTTNLLALDNSGRQVVEDRVTVFNRLDSVVTLQRGPARTTFNCIGERCEVQPTPGDVAESFDAVSGQVQTRDTQLKSAAARQ